jgi:Fe-S cluster assembly ATP-binding protein
MLKIENLHVRVEGQQILCGVNLEVAAGEVHALMGPNGSGKSTLCHVLAGREGFEVTEGRVLYEGQDLLALSPEARAREGLFLGFQYPVEIPGVSNLYFLKAALNAQRRHRGLPELDALEFLNLAREKMGIVELPEKLAHRAVNEGFSGGEKKRNEVFQMLLLEPKLAILDETDSGLDVDALRVVGAGINHLRHPQRSILLVTHYERLLDHVIPDRVHVLRRGRIAYSADQDLARVIAERGYAWLDRPEQEPVAFTPEANA